MTLSTYCIEHELLLRKRQHERDRYEATAAEPTRVKMRSSPDNQREERAAT